MSDISVWLNGSEVEWSNFQGLIFQIFFVSQHIETHRERTFWSSVYPKALIGKQSRLNRGPGYSKEGGWLIDVVADLDFDCNIVITKYTNNSWYLRKNTLVDDYDDDCDDDCDGGVKRLNCTLIEHRLGPFDLNWTQSALFSWPWWWWWWSRWKNDDEDGRFDLRRVYYPTSGNYYDDVSFYVNTCRVGGAASAVVIVCSPQGHPIQPWWAASSLSKAPKHKSSSSSVWYPPLIICSPFRSQYKHVKK